MLGAVGLRQGRSARVRHEVRRRTELADEVLPAFAVVARFPLHRASGIPGPFYLEHLVAPRQPEIEVRARVAGHRIDVREPLATAWRDARRDDDGVIERE